MTTTEIILDKKAHPLMMHLSIVPKYEVGEEICTYNPQTQTSNLAAMSNSWCVRSSSTVPISKANDDDQQEDD